MIDTVQKLCPQCQGAVSADARFCKHCAFDFSAVPAPPSSDITETPPPPAPPTRGVSLPVVIAGAAALLVVVVVIAAVAVATRGGKSGVSTNTQNANLSAALANGQPSGDRVRQIEERILRGETLVENDVRGLPLPELRILRNVYFAKYGRKYDEGGPLGSYFYGRPWYKPSADFKESLLTADDKANIDVIIAVENAAVDGLSRDWETFWTTFKSAVEKGERSTVRMMMAPDFTYSFGATSGGDARDNAFREWDDPRVNGWSELKKVLAQGTAVEDAPTAKAGRIAPPVAAREEYFNYRAVFEQGHDGRWRCVAFVAGD